MCVFCFVLCRQLIISISRAATTPECDCHNDAVLVNTYGPCSPNFFGRRAHNACDLCVAELSSGHQALRKTTPASCRSVWDVHSVLHRHRKYLLCLVSVRLFRSGGRVSRVGHPNQPGRSRRCFCAVKLEDSSVAHRALVRTATVAERHGLRMPLDDYLQARKRRRLDKKQHSTRAVSQRAGPRRCRNTRSSPLC